jgi:hypothetical protein
LVNYCCKLGPIFSSIEISKSFKVQYHEVFNIFLRNLCIRKIHLLVFFIC